MNSVIVGVIRAARKREAVLAQVNVNLVSSDLGLTRQHVSRLFSLATHTFLRVYLKRRRMRQAARLLVNRPKMPVREVARAAGYASENHFRCEFGKVFGVPPARYRRNALRARLGSP